MDDDHIFAGSRNELLEQLLGDDTTPILDDDVALTILEFLTDQGAEIKPLEVPGDSLEVRLGGPVFVSVRKFLWDSASAIVGLAVAITTHDPNVLTSAAGVLGNLLAAISIFPTDTTEFKVYAAVAALRRESPNAGAQSEEIRAWIQLHSHDVSDQEVTRAIDVLLAKQLLRRSGQDRVRIVW
jgi:hypothetical protein